MSTQQVRLPGSSPSSVKQFRGMSNERARQLLLQQVRSSRQEQAREAEAAARKSERSKLSSLAKGFRQGIRLS